MPGERSDVLATSSATCPPPIDAAFTRRNAAGEVAVACWACGEVSIPGFTAARRSTVNTQLTGQQLRRSRRDRVFFGVCGGIAEYFTIDPVLVRLAFVIVTLAGGAGVLAYIVLAIVMPESEPVPTGSGEGPFLTEGTPQTNPMAGRNASMIGALILIGIGMLFLIDNLRWFGWFRPGLFWPLILIGIGAGLLAKRSTDAR
jgi:phage shock protein C